MLHINGFTIIAHHWDDAFNGYTVLGVRHTFVYTHGYEYVVGIGLPSLESPSWASGFYTGSLTTAVSKYTEGI